MASSLDHPNIFTIHDIAETERRAGDLQEAKEYYSRLGDLWQDCDPSLHSERDEVLAAWKAIGS